MRWLRKAILRAGGVIALHDEAAIYATQTAARISLLTSFKAVTLEGLEVVLMVIATGARGLLVPAAVGAALAGALGVVAGVGLRRPLARVPENALKFGVGVLLSAFGVFWIGEGLGYPWPGQDLALLGLVVGFSASGWLALARPRRAPAPAGGGPAGGARRRGPRPAGGRRGGVWSGERGPR